MLCHWFVERRDLPCKWSQQRGLEPFMCLKHHPLADDEGSCKAAINVRCRNSFAKSQKWCEWGEFWKLARKLRKLPKPHVWTAPPADSTMSANLFQSVESQLRDIARACFIFGLKAEKVCNYFTSDRNKLWFHFLLWEFRLNFRQMGFPSAVRRTWRLFASSQMSFHVFALIVMLSSKKTHDMAGGKAFSINHLVIDS